MKKTSSLPIICIFVAFIYSLTHLSIINQITGKTFSDVTHLFYAIFFLVLLFGIASHYGFFQIVGEAVSKILTPLLHLNTQESAVYIASIFSGFPTFAKVIKDAHLPQESVHHLLKFCSHPSIGFVVITIGEELFHDIKIGYWLFFIQLLTNFSIALFNRKAIRSDSILTHHVNTSFISLIRQQFKSSVEIFVYVFGFMLVFRILIEALPFSHPLVSGILEFSQGCLNLVGYSKTQSFILISGFLSFSSLSVIFQVLSILDNVISIRKYIFYRLIQSSVSMIYAYLLTLFLF